MKIKYYHGIGLVSIILISIFLTFLFISCKKFLDAKPNKSLVVPNTLEDLQAILDYSSRMNLAPSYAEASSDNYYLTSDIYNSISDDIRNAYIWENYSYDNYPNDWARVYDIIYPANLVLESIEKIIPGSQMQMQWNNIKGSALVFRAFSLMQGADMFCKAYDNETAEQDLGMVIRLSSDINAKSVRSSLRKTYERIIADLKDAAPLLPPMPLHTLRPSKAAAYGLLARTYLAMHNYDSCKKYADLCLAIKHTLLDFNSLPDIGGSAPIPPFNNEVIMAITVANAVYYFTSQPYAIVDSALYNSYAEDDLRKTAFFQKSGAGMQFKGSYSGTPWEPFAGIATDEVLLMRAECYARSGQKELAMKDLNSLLETRWKNGLFVPFFANTDAEALSLILAERRKELIFRNLRWMDIKRLNKEGANIVLKRIVNGQAYTLLPNENRYALPLPMDIINMTGMEQNPR